MIIIIIRVLILIISVLMGLAYLTLAERKVMGSMQRRIGPNEVGIYGLGQPIMDGVKLVWKESIVPIQANKGLYLIAPISSLILGLILWGVIPINKEIQIFDMKNDLLYILAISSISIITVLWSGWSSNSKYALLGSLRSTSQMISYEVIIGLIILNTVFISGHFNLSEIIISQTNISNIYFLFPLFFLFLIAIVAETNRAPFDLPESESELVSGFNTEYSAAPFALWFISEYGNIIFMSLLSVNLFLSAQLIFLPFILFFFIWIRASYPRFRYTDLMSICWESLLPLTFGFIILVSSLILI